MSLRERVRLRIAFGVLGVVGLAGVAIVGLGWAGAGRQPDPAACQTALVAVMTRAYVTASPIPDGSVINWPVACDGLSPMTRDTLLDRAYVEVVQNG